MYYEDDHFSPVNKNDMDENNNRNLQNYIDLKKIDKGYGKIKRKLNTTWIDGKFYKNINIEYYTSKQYIRNAITGQRYNNIKIGSIYEDFYFKVKVSNCEFTNEKGILYYDSPEQFEKHQFIILSREVKEMWHNKNLAIRLLIAKE
jgi:hypothetical protein